MTIYDFTVIAQDGSPFYQWLKEQASGPLGSRIEWNFAKFLINRQGQVIHRFSSKTDPQAIEASLKEVLSD